MHGNTLAGPGIVFFQGLLFALVLGALGMIVHALRLPPTRARFSRWIWVALGAAYVACSAWALIWPSVVAFTVMGIGTVVILAAEVAGDSIRPFMNAPSPVLIRLPSREANSAVIDNSSAAIVIGEIGSSPAILITGLSAVTGPLKWKLTGLSEPDVERSKSSWPCML